MKKQLYGTLLCMLCHLFPNYAFSQVNIDKPIHLTGGSGERSITNLELPVNGSDAVNKDYVDGLASGSSHYIGELFGGGVIAGLWTEADVEHGLIISPVDISAGRSWSTSYTAVPSPGAKSTWDGLTNSNAIMAQNANSAAGDCRNYSGAGYSDWYLPSQGELQMVWTNLFLVNRALSNTPGAAEVAVDYYWSSTEHFSMNNFAWYFNFIDIALFNNGKENTGRVRAVRSF